MCSGGRRVCDRKTQGEAEAALELKPSWAICIREFNLKKRMLSGSAVGIWVCLAPQWQPFLQTLQHSSWQALGIFRGNSSYVCKRDTLARTTLLMTKTHIYYVWRLSAGENRRYTSPFFLTKEEPFFLNWSNTVLSLSIQSSVYLFPNQRISEWKVIRTILPLHFTNKENDIQRELRRSGEK